MVSKSNNRKARSERAASPRPDRPPARSKMDSVKSLGMGRETVRNRNVLDNSVRDLSRPLPANENARREWQSRMGQVTQAIKASQAESLQRLNDAHVKATTTTTLKRPNSAMLSQHGSLRLPPDGTRIGKSRSAKSLQKVVSPIENPPKKKGVALEGVSPSKRGSLGVEPLPTREARNTTAKKPERSEKLRDAPVCKERPERNSGMGTSRHFVPWCGRRG